MMAVRDRPIISTSTQTPVNLSNRHEIHKNVLHTARYVAVAIVVLCLVSALTACNARKKNTAAARQYTAFITRYNIHYNGDRHYNETLETMERDYEDNFTELLPVHPAEAHANEQATKPQGDFTRSIEKAQKAIQLRSITKKPQRKAGKAADASYKAWMKRDEYNPFLHNSWLMMGRSQYMNGDFTGAAATFFYISRHFSWLPATVTEARLWQARCYLAMGWLFEAEQIITRIKPDDIENNGTLTQLYNLDFGEFYVKSHDYARAAPYLAEAARHASGAQKTRLNFLLGQVYERLGDKALAYKAFGKAAGSSSAAYRTKFNARIKQSEVFEGSNIEPEVKALRRMTHYDRNKEYLDQIYYAIGNLYLSRRDTSQAVKNYVLAAEKSTRNGIDKAISQLALGKIYYEQGRYELAQPCYSEAVPQLPANYPGLDSLRRRSDVLDELATYSQNVAMQDSLLRLADMDSLKRMAVIDKIIDDLKKKEREEAEAARREEFVAQRDAQGSSLQSSAKDPAQFVMNTDDSWYFYNNAARTAGRTEFQRRWGSRRLEDNWRRRNKTSFNAADFDMATNNADDTDADSNAAAADSTAAELSPVDREKQLRADDPHFPEYYLKQIPFTAEQKQVANEVIQDGLYNMGLILKDKMEDYRAAAAQWDRLLADYPDNVYRLDVYYNMYLMMARRNNTRMAERYRALIMSDFPDSKYAVALRNPDYIGTLRNMEREQENLYEQAFQAYNDNDNARVHAIYDDVAERYPMSALMPRFMFLHALAYVTDRKPEEFNNVLRDLLERYPDTQLTPYASAWLKGMAQGRQLNTSATNANMRGLLWSISLGNDSTAVAGTDAIPFTLNDDDRQLLVFVYDTGQVNTNTLLYEIARHNFASFVVKDFDLEAMNFGPLGMIVVKDFESLPELNHYRRVMADSPTFVLPPGVRPVVISAPNFDALLHSGGSLDDYFRYLDEQNYIDAQADILPFTEIETLDEAESAEAPASAENPDSPDAPDSHNNSGAPVATPDTPASASKPAAADKPAPKPAAATVPAAKPAATPKPTPKPPQKPQYVPGSEGDDEDENI